MALRARIYAYNRHLSFDVAFICNTLTHCGVCDLSVCTSKMGSELRASACLTLEMIFLPIRGRPLAHLVARWAAEWRVERSILLWGNVSSQIHLISPGCPRPNSALTVHKSGLKHRSSIHPSCQSSYVLQRLWFCRASDTVFRREIDSQRQWGYGTCYGDSFPRCEGVYYIQ